MISFETTGKESEIIDKIVRRAERLRMDVNRCALLMDITATHANGCPLKLEDLLTARDFDFLYDIVGIMNHIDRETGQLDGFLPHFAA